MSLIGRIANLWRLSEFEPGKPTDEYKIPGTEVSMIIKKPKQEGKFIPFVKEDPIKQLIEEIP